MRCFLKCAVTGWLLGMWVGLSVAEEGPKPQGAKPQVVTTQSATTQAKSLDQQLQEIKKEVLEISAGLAQLEEKLLYPASTQLAIFLSVDQANQSRLDAVTIKVDGKVAAHYIYAAKELQALQRGGVQRLHVGNIGSGEHALDVVITGKLANNSDYQQKASHKFTKEVGAKLIEIAVGEPNLGSQTISFKD